MFNEENKYSPGWMDGWVDGWMEPAVKKVILPNV